MRRSYILAILVILFASPAQATPGWDRFVSSRGFSLEYPRRWAAMNHRSSTFRDNGKVQDFVLRYGPDDTPPPRGAIAFPYRQAELRVVEIENPIDFQTVFSQLEASEQSEREGHTYYRNERHHIMDIDLHSNNNFECANLREVAYKNYLGGGGPRRSDSAYTQEFDYYCTIGDRSFRISLEYRTFDRRAKELQRVALSVAKSLRLDPARPAAAPAKRPQAATSRKSTR